MAATLDFIVSRIGPIAPLLLLVDHFETIQDTIKSTLVATEIENNEKRSRKPYFLAKDGSVGPQC